MTPLASTLLYMHVVWVTGALEPVYAAHLRRHELGPELRAEQLAEDLVVAAELAGVPLALLAALEHDESGGDHSRVSSEGALGRMQLNPASRWGRAWLKECPGGAFPNSTGRVRRDVAPRGVSLDSTTCEALNVLWGAYALRDAIEACGGDAHRALGFYRSGRCVAGPRGAETLELAEWLAWRLADTRFGGNDG
jgi:hypothetical protein